MLETDTSLKMRLCQVGSFMMGVVFMYSVALLEEMEEHGHEHSLSEEHKHSEL